MTMLDTFMHRPATCKQRLQDATDRAEQSFRKLMAVLDREPINYLPLHSHHGVSLAKATDRSKG